jgi:hypothetical protein
MEVMRSYLAVAVLLLVCAGCSGVKGSPAAVSSSVPPSAPSSVAQSTSAEYVARMAVEKHLSSGMPTNDELATLGGRYSYGLRLVPITENNPYGLVVPCGKPTDADRKAVYAVDGTWNEGGGGFEQVGQYEGGTGAEAIAALKTAVSCGSVDGDSDYPQRFRGEIVLPKLEGTEAQFAFCTEFFEDGRLAGCRVTMAKGNFAAVVKLPATGSSDRELRAELIALLPIFVHAFQRL